MGTSEKQKPKLIIVTGRPGSGKTTLSKELSKTLYLPLVVGDEIKEGYVNTFNVKHDQLGEDTNRIVTEVFFKNIELLLTCNISLIIEAAFQHQVWQSKIEHLKKLAIIMVIICECGDKVAAQRHCSRGVSDPQREYYHGDSQVAHFKKTGEILPPAHYEAPTLNVPTLKVSTLDGYNPTLEVIIERIVSWMDVVKKN